MARKKKKKGSWIIITLIILFLTLFSLNLFGVFDIIPSLQMTGFESEFEKSGISCNTISDCSNYLLNQGVSQENINKVEFRCDNVCYFKEK